ncbi:YcdB/YcdC domain-containing protein [Vallitalea okinawensis]|uniref:YcdB/YcdC domain-containing protein n=1 Tax=Vallitalea okinawensis TaxID=2078660 RepID=UPI000CFBDEEB|nr:YcdB/YcdC domain-containing protein [Vallitalea okinawensis]
MKYFRKITSCFLTTVLLMTPLLSLNAASSTVVSNKVVITQNENQTAIDDSSYTIKMDDAIQLAMGFVHTYTNYVVTNEECSIALEDQVYWYYEDEDIVWWEVSWDFDRKDEYFNINVLINASTGEIMSYDSHIYNHENDLEKLPSLTGDEAKALAINFVTKMHPDKIDMLEVGDVFTQSYDAIYSMHFQRKVNGISTTDGIAVEVDGQSGEVAGYRITWNDDVTFEDPEVIQSKEEAKAVFLDAMSMELGYTPIMDDNYEVESLKLVYNMNTEKHAIKAADLSSESDTINVEVVDDDTHINKEFTLSEDEKVEYLELANLLPIELVDEKLTHEQADKIGQHYIDTLLGKGFYIEDLEYRTDYEGNKTWDIRCSSEAESRYYHYGANMELEPNGKLKRFYRYNEESEMDKADEGQERIQPEELYSKAAKIIAMIYPDEFSQMGSVIECGGVSWGYNDKDYDNLMYVFTMNQMEELEHHGGMSVEIGAYSGTIYNIDYEWVDIEIPELEPVLTAEEAKAKLIEIVDIELRYGINSDEESETKEAILYYYLKTEVNDSWVRSVDAINGELLNYQGRNVYELNSANALTDHWAANELKMMDEKEIIDLDSIEVDDPITVNEFIDMLVQASGYKYYRLDDAPALLFTNVSEEDAYYDTLRLAVYDNIIDNEAISWEGNRHLTREEMAMYMIRMLGFGKVADLEGIYKSSFIDAVDISKEMLGSVALCEGFGILEGADGAFNPKEELTYAEAAMAVYKILTKPELVQ